MVKWEVMSSAPPQSMRSTALLPKLLYQCQPYPQSSDTIYRPHPKGTIPRRLPPGGRHPSGAWRCAGRRPVQGGRNAPLKVCTNQRRGSRGRNLLLRAGVQGAAPHGALSSGLSPGRIILSSATKRKRAHRRAQIW